MTQETEPSGQGRVDVDPRQFLHDINEQKDYHVWELGNKRLFDTILFNELGIIERINAFVEAHEDSQILISEPETGYLAIVTRWNFRQEEGREVFDEAGVAYIGSIKSISRVSQSNMEPGLDVYKDWADYFLVLGNKPKIIQVFLSNTHLKNFLDNVKKADELVYFIDYIERETDRQFGEDEYFFHETFGESKSEAALAFDGKRSETTNKLYRALVEAYALPRTGRNARIGLNLSTLGKLHSRLERRQKENMQKVSQASDKIWRDAMRRSKQPIPDISGSESRDVEEYLEQQRLEEEEMDLWDDEFEMYGDDQYASHEGCVYHEEYDEYTSDINTSDFHSHVDG